VNVFVLWADGQRWYNEAGVLIVLWEQCGVKSAYCRRVMKQLPVIIVIRTVNTSPARERLSDTLDER
jgi:hypothetical protein